MATKNDITGDSISTKQVTDKYRDNWDKIFGQKEAAPPKDQIEKQRQMTELNWDGDD